MTLAGIRLTRGFGGLWSGRSLRSGAAVLALVIGLAIAWLVAANNVRHASVAELVLIPLVGWSFAASGLVAWGLRADNRIGPAMVVTAFLWFASALYWSQDTIAFSVGHMFEAVYLGGIVYVLLAFPTGRLGTTFNRTLAIVVLVVAGPAEVLFLMLGGHAVSSGCPGCPAFAFQLVDAGTVARQLQMVQHVMGVGSIALAGAVLVRRWRGASEPLRFAIAPVIWTGTAALPVFALWVVNEALNAPLGDVGDIGLDLALVAVAGSFLAGVARTRFARSGVADLLLEIGGTLAPGALQMALARALHDPSLSIGYWLPETERFVDGDGARVDLPLGGHDRAITMIERDGRRIAALIHDPALDDEPLLRSVCAAAALALENERLQAELRARLLEVQESRARIVEATQEERRRIERDLHDGTQQRLVSIAMTLGLAAAKAESDPGSVVPLIGDARSGLTNALTELRELSQGIHPGLLTERGLAAALDDLASRMRMLVDLQVQLLERLPAPIETAAYYVVAEALTNVAKYAQATTTTVRITCDSGAVHIEISDDGVGGADPDLGSGLRGMRDRIDALGGRFEVTSQPDEGTTIRAVIPCG